MTFSQTIDKIKRTATTSIATLQTLHTISFPDKHTLSLRSIRIVLYHSCHCIEIVLFFYFMFCFIILYYVVDYLLLSQLCIVLGQAIMIYFQ